MNDPLGYTKSIDDMVFNEVDYVGSLNFGEWYCLRLFGKVLGDHEDIPMSFCRRGSNRSHDVHSPHFKGPRGDSRVE